jgi:hypothetical protein
MLHLKIRDDGTVLVVTAFEGPYSSSVIDKFCSCIFYFKTAKTISNIKIIKKSLRNCHVSLHVVHKMNAYKD